MTYTFDWKDVVHGSFEIEASSSSEALDKFKSLSKDELYKKSNWDTDGKEVKVKYRDVHARTLTNDVQYFPPKERVY